MCSSRTVHRTPRRAHVQQLNYCVKKRQSLLHPTCDLQTAQISVLCTGQIYSVNELKWQLINVWCGLEQSVFDEAIDQWRGRHQACVHAKGRHFEYNVDFVHICYIQCDLFNCYIFNYEIMPATLAHTFLCILQGSAPANVRYGGRF